MIAIGMGRSRDTLILVGFRIASVMLMLMVREVRRLDTFLMLAIGSYRRPGDLKGQQTCNEQQEPAFCHEAIITGMWASRNHSDDRRILRQNRRNQPGQLILQYFVRNEISRRKATIF